MADVRQQIERANARVAGYKAKGAPVHGHFQLLGEAKPGQFPLIRCGLHCEACDLQVGGAFDLSGELGVTTVAEQETELLELLARRGCPHVSALLSDQ